MIQRSHLSWRTVNQRIMIRKGIRCRYYGDLHHRESWHLKLGQNGLRNLHFCLRDFTRFQRL